MKTFRAYLGEDNEGISQKNISDLKKYVINSFETTPTSSTRGAYHVRFPSDKKDSQLNSFLSKYDLGIKEYDKPSISSKFDTYYIFTTKQINTIPPGTQIPWVNNYIGAATSGAQLFNNKDLNPDNLGLAGITANQNKIISKVSSILKTKYDKEISDQLIELMQISKTKSKTVPIPDGVTFSSKDLAKVSADFGEILAGIWCQSALGFRETFFPKASNEKLVDVYGIRLGTRFPISVKSGGGGKVTIQNIIDAISNRAKTASMEYTDEPSLVIFKIVNENSAKEQMIMLHQFMDTPAIKELSKIMKIPKKSITLKAVNSFVSKKTNQDLIKLLAPFWKKLNMKLSDRILMGDDKARLIISPLGESIWKVLNKDSKIKASLNNIAKQVMLIQVNVDVYKKKINFEHNSFKKAVFEFGWAGYIAGNKLGFKMKLVK